MKTIIFIITLIFPYHSMAMAKTFIWHCQVSHINDKKQTNGKISQYKIDVTTPMVWFGNETRWSGFVNTEYRYDTKNNNLYSISTPWNGVYELETRSIIFTNKDSNLKVLYKCKELE